MKKLAYKILSKLNTNFIKDAAIPVYPKCIGYESEKGLISCPDKEVDVYGKEGDIYRCFSCEKKQKEFEKSKPAKTTEDIDFIQSVKAKIKDAMDDLFPDPSNIYPAQQGTMALNDIIRIIIEAVNYIDYKMKSNRRSQEIIKLLFFWKDIVYFGAHSPMDGRKKVAFYTNLGKDNGLPLIYPTDLSPEEYAINMINT